MLLLVLRSTPRLCCFCLSVLTILPRLVTDLRCWRCGRWRLEEQLVVSVMSEISA